MGHFKVKRSFRLYPLFRNRAFHCCDTLCQAVRLRTKSQSESNYLQFIDVITSSTFHRLLLFFLMNFLAYSFNHTISVFFRVLSCIIFCIFGKKGFAFIFHSLFYLFYYLFIYLYIYVVFVSLFYTYFLFVNRQVNMFFVEVKVAQSLIQGMRGVDNN